MAITVFSPVDALKRAVNAKGANMGLISDTEYLGFVVGHADAPAQTYQFTQIGTNYALLGHGGTCLYGSSSAYTETGGVSSMFYCGWENTAPSVIVTAGTQTGATLSVSAIPIDWRTLLYDFIEMLKGHAARMEDTSSLGGAAKGYTSLMDKLDTWQGQVRGGFYG